MTDSSDTRTQTASSDSATHYRLPIRRPVTVAMIFLTLLVFGLRSYRELPLSLMPDISYPTLTVRTEYEGSAPEDVEKLVTRPLEERLSIVNGVIQISSTSSAGLSEIVLEFTWDTNMDVALQDVRESLDLFDQPAAVTQKPVILRYDPTLDPVMRVAVAPGQGSDDASLRAQLAEIRNAAEEQVKSDLEAEEGIAQVSIKGGREEEIQILVDSQRLKSLGLAPADVVASLEQQNINLSGGRLREGKAEYLVRTLNEFQDIDEIRAVRVTVAQSMASLAATPAAPVQDRQSLRLEDIARVELGEKDPDTIVRVNGREAVQLEFFKEGDANVVEVCEKLRAFFFTEDPSPVEKIMDRVAERMPGPRGERLRERLERRRKLADQISNRLPDFAQPTLITDQSRFIVASIREVQQTALVGGFLALVMLFLFLREIKSTVIVGLAIPISVVATFVPMFIGDISLNIMSLGGIALGIGMLVDNSIVVLESIFRCTEEGDDTVDAAERGTKEVAGAVTASTLTTIAVFFPLVFVEGIAGQLFRDLALTVSFSLIASLLVALYLIPMIASRVAVPLTAREEVIWVLRGYRESRGPEGRSVMATILQLPATGVRYSRIWIANTWRETVGLAVRGAARTVEIDGEVHRHNVFLRSAAILSLPFVALLFVLQTLLKLLATGAVTLLFCASVVLVTVLWIVSKLAGWIMYFPVTFFDIAFRSTRRAYEVFLRKALYFSPIVLVLVLALAVHAGVVSTRLGRELIPPLKQGEFGIRLETRPGTRLEDTALRAARIDAIVRANPYVDSVTVEVGAHSNTAGEEKGENLAALTVKLKDPETTVPMQDQIIDDIRERVLEVPADNIVFTLPTLFSFNNAVELQIFGDDLDRLRLIGGDVLRELESVDGLKDVALSLKEGYPEVHIMLDRELLTAKKLSPYEIAQSLRTEVQGDVATRFSRGGEKVDIRVKSDRARLASLHDLRNLSVVDGNPPTPLSSVATIEVTEGPSEIRRVDQRQVMIVSANVEGRDLGSVTRDIVARVQPLAANWPEDYRYALGGQNRELETSYGGLIFALLLAIFLVYVVMACQFESLWHPALIMFSVPLAFIGVAYVLDWFHVNLSVVVLIGGIVLAGIVVNDAIVLVDYINQLRARGHNKVDAVVDAAKVRFRPILMTTMTTVLGLVPMVVAGGEGQEIRQPMAITVMAGLTSATILTLIIIPMVYYTFAGRDRA